jgi:hypothetical protein
MEGFFYCSGEQFISSVQKSFVYAKKHDIQGINVRPERLILVGIKKLMTLSIKKQTNIIRKFFKI